MLARPAPFVPFNEMERIRALTSTCLLDSACDPAFDAITRLAASVFEAPIATVSLIDQHRQWFKSSVGVTCKETPREDSFCAHTILQRAPLLVMDAREDRRFQDKSVVTMPGGVRFYLGVPIHAEDGMPIGALCVADTVPRSHVSPEAIALLQSLAGNVDKLVRAHRCAGYIDAGSGLPNQRRFRENMYPLANYAGAAGAPSQWWAFSIEVASAAQVQEWLENDVDSRLDARFREVGEWVAATTPLHSGVYRLSTRHVGFFVAATAQSHVQTLTSVLQQGLDRLFPNVLLSVLSSVPPSVFPSAAGANCPDAQRWAVRAVALPCGSSADLLNRLLTPSTVPPCAAPKSVHSDAAWSWQPRLTLASRECVGFDVDAGIGAWSADSRDVLLTRFADSVSEGERGRASLQIAMPGTVFFTEDIGEWQAALANHQLVPRQLSWAVSVEVVRDALDRVKARCEQVRAAGIGVVVTGFGAGYDSLAWLPSLPLSGVSFDARVVGAVRENARHAATVRRMVSLAHALSARVSAPGLDDAFQLETARLLNCDEGTGAELATPALTE